MIYLINLFNELPSHIQTPLITAIGTISAALITVALGTIIFYTDKISKKKTLDINLRKDEYLKIIESAYKLIGVIPQIASQDNFSDTPNLAKEINDHLAVIMLVTLVGSKETIEKTLDFHKKAYACAMEVGDRNLQIRINNPDISTAYANSAAINVLAKATRDKEIIHLYRETLRDIYNFKELISEIIISMRRDISDSSFLAFNKRIKDRYVAKLINEVMDQQITLEHEFFREPSNNSPIHTSVKST